MKPFFELARQSLLSNWRPLSFPMKVTLILTKRCNSRCLMCNIWQETDHGGELTSAEWERFFARAGRISWLDLAGGEIVLRPDLAAIVGHVFRYCRQLYLLHFATNGFLPEKTVALTEAILAHNPRKLLVTVSLDGDRETHERIRGVAGSFAKTLETFSRLRKLERKNFKVFLGMTLFDENSDRLPETLAAVREAIPDFTLDELHLNIMQLSSHYYNNLGVKVSDPGKILETIDSLRRAQPGSLLDPVHYLEARYQKLAHTFLASKRCPLPCQALANSCYIAPNGSVYPCNMFDRLVGNLRDFDFDLGRLWRSEPVVSARRAVAAGECPQCWTPCEAYQTIIGNFLGLRGRGKK